MLLQIRHETRYEYQEPVSYSIQALKLTPRADPGQRVVSWRVLVPGERAHRTREERQRDGVEVDATAWAQIKALAGELGVTAPEPVADG